MAVIDKDIRRWANERPKTCNKPIRSYLMQAIIDEFEFESSSTQSTEKVGTPPNNRCFSFMIGQIIFNKIS